MGGERQIFAFVESFLKVYGANVDVKFYLKPFFIAKIA
jgi:hypothetical protein